MIKITAKHAIIASSTAILIAASSAPLPADSTTVRQSCTETKYVPVSCGTASMIAALDAYFTSLEPKVAATRPEVSAELALAYQTLNKARQSIVVDCATPLSAELCWTAKPDPELAGAVARGTALLKKAGEAIGKLPRDIGNAERRNLENRLELLRTFSNLFGALATLDDSKKGRNQLIDAGVDVSIYLDDPNPGVADSAKLWQGVAYRRAGRPDRTLQLLWPAIGQVSSNRIDFFARVERCRALTEKEQYVSALALAIKLGEHLDDWMKDEDASTKTKAADSLRWVRAMIHRDWAESLRKSGETERARTADQAAAKLLGEHPFPVPPKDWLQLSETIAGLPEWNPVELAPASQPAEEKS